MVTETRSGRHHGDLDGSSLKKKQRNGRRWPPCNSGEDNILQLRRSGRETASSKESTLSPINSKKSKNFEKGTPPSTPPSHRRSERLEKQNAPYPLRKFHRGMKNASSSSFGSLKSTEELNLSGQKRKKVKNKTKAQAYKGLFKKQKKKEIAAEIATSNSNPNFEYDQNSVSLGIDDMGETEEIVALSDEQKSLHTFLRGETEKLCKILKLPEDVNAMVKTCLTYVIKNLQVSTESPVYVQALQISLCWIAASMMEHKVDKKESLMSARQRLNYQCTKKQVTSVYSKMLSLKKFYMLCSENSIGCGNLDDENLCTKASNVNEELAEDLILLQQEMKVDSIAVGIEIENNIRKIQKKCEKRIVKLDRKHLEEIQTFNRIWEERGEELKADYNLKSTIIRTVHDEGLIRMDKLKFLNENFAKAMEQHDLLKDMELKSLETKQLDAKNAKEQRVAHWLDEVKSNMRELKFVDGKKSLGCQSEDGAIFSQSSTAIPISCSLWMQSPCIVSRQKIKVQVKVKVSLGMVTYHL